MQLGRLIIWMLWGMAAGITAYWLVDHLPFLFRLAPRLRGCVSLALGACLALGPLVVVGMGWG